MLTPRTETILKSIVGQYIAKAMPIPSQSLIGDPELRVSSATIRNEMAHLEQEGYIYRAHSSAGSIPLDKGYRRYVESLGDIRLPAPEQRLVNHLFHQIEEEPKEWLNLAASIIAQLVQNIAIVTLPRPGACQFKRLELISLQESVALFVLVLNGARVRQQLLTYEYDISQSELTAIANKTNDAFSGLTMTRIQARKIELSPIEEQIVNCVIKIMTSEDAAGNEESYLDGLHLMLDQPEFTHNVKALALTELIDHRRLLGAITPPELPDDRVQVVIGTENQEKIMQDYSVVMSRYGLPRETTGTICVVGPTRMPYARTIATVDYIAQVMNRLTVRLYGKDEPVNLEQNTAN